SLPPSLNRGIQLIRHEENKAPCRQPLPIARHGGAECRHLLAEQRHLLQAVDMRKIEVGLDRKIDDEHHTSRENNCPEEPQPARSEVKTNEEQQRYYVREERKMIPAQPFAIFRSRGGAHHAEFEKARGGYCDTEYAEHQTGKSFAF